MKDTRMTSVNSKTAPAIFKYLAEQHLLDCSDVFDFGCGKYFETTRDFCFREGASKYSPYDLYWEIGGVPIGTKFDIVVCANVLNVIEDDFERFLALAVLKDLCKEGGYVAIQIYEGNKTNIAKDTTKGYQLNRMIQNYYNEVREIFNEEHWEITRHRNFYILRYLLPWE